jgi:hypothetical protein
MHMSNRNFKEALMKSVELEFDREIKWPTKCAICNEDCGAHAQTNYRVIDKYLLIALGESILRIKYPVCKKHKLIAKFYGFVTNQSFAVGFVMALSFPFLFSIIVTSGGSLDPRYNDFVYIGSFVFFALWVIYLKFMNPVKITKARKNNIRLRFKNIEYANDFEQANQRSEPKPESVTAA